MNKTWLVARHEYLTHLKRRSFLFAAFGVPLLMVVVMVIVIAVAINSQTSIESLGNIGYVDNAGVLAEAVNKPSMFVAYASDEAARAALDAGEIGAYFVVDETYMRSGKVQIYALGSTPEALQGRINGFLLSNLSANLDTPVPMARLYSPVNMTIVIQDTGRELTREAIGGLFITPMLFAMVFMMSSQITSSFLMSGVVEEKSSRLMEILITSITPMQMLLGKLIGLGLLGLTQLVIWIVAGLVLVNVGGSEVPFLAGISIPADLIVLSVVYFLLNYFLLSSILAGIGVVVGTEQESRQYAGIFSLVIVLPFFFMVQFIEDPGGTLPVILTLFPFTAGLSVILRVSFSSVPLWQIALSIGLLFVITVVITWASAKVFRWATLLYGKKATPREIWRVIRGSVDVGTSAARSGKKVVA